jgi:hypothetical protein
MSIIFARAAEMVVESREPGKTTEEQIGAVLAWAKETGCLSAAGLIKESVKISPDAADTIAVGYAKDGAIAIEAEQVEKACMVSETNLINQDARR